MSTQYAQVIVYLPEPVDGTMRSAVQQAVSAHPGVGRAETSPAFERLILIDYDPLATNGQEILASVCRRGVSARLIGM